MWLRVYAVVLTALVVWIFAESARLVRRVHQEMRAQDLVDRWHPSPDSPRP
jgi:hypothetical protein